MRYRYIDEVEYIQVARDSRSRISSPVGILYRPCQIKDLLDKVSYQRKQGLLVSTVGDRVTHTLLSNNFIPDLAVIDGKERRAKFSFLNLNKFKLVIYVENKKGYVNIAITDIIGKNLHEAPLLLYIRGEEDLVGFPVVLALPLYSYMLYGQPNEGIVLLEIDEKAKNTAKKLLRIA